MLPITGRGAGGATGPGPESKVSGQGEFLFEGLGNGCKSCRRPGLQSNVNINISLVFSRLVEYLYIHVKKVHHFDTKHAYSKGAGRNWKKIQSIILKNTK